MRLPGNYATLRKQHEALIRAIGEAVQWIGWCEFGPPDYRKDATRLLRKLKNEAERITGLEFGEYT